MELTKEQIEFLDKVCFGRDNWKLNENGEVDVDGNVYMSSMNLTEIPVRFGSVGGSFHCNDNQLTSLKGCPKSIRHTFYCYYNNLTNYFKTIKEKDFPHWKNLHWGWTLEEYPFLINIAKKYAKNWRVYLDECPQTKLYLE